jgi:hypothetical protein
MNSSSISHQSTQQKGIPYNDILSSLNVKIGANGILQFNRNDKAEQMKNFQQPLINKNQQRQFQHLPPQQPITQQQPFYPQPPTQQTRQPFYSQPTQSTQSTQPTQPTQPTQQFYPKQPQTIQLPKTDDNENIVVENEQKELSPYELELLKRQQAINYFQKINSKKTNDGKTKKMMFN